MASARPVRIRRWPTVVAWMLWALAMAGLPVIGWLDQLLRQAGRPDLAPLTPEASVVTGLGILVGAWSLLTRFRRAHGVERQPLRWVALAAVSTAVVVLAIVAVTAAGLEAPSDWLVGICMALLPVAIGAAILRYRLYDLDRIISAPWPMGC